jgi:hypothetical protein
MNPILYLPLALFASGPDDPLTRFEFDGGVEVQVLHFPQAPRQSTFTFIDFGLLDDGPHRAQWAHLVEHALIRWHDGGPGEVELRVNGETRGGTMHLESLAPVERWGESLAMHVRWLNFTAIDGETLAREIGRVQGEVDSTQANGFTHKWALAGAAQVLLHGLEHARVRGDVGDATPEDLAQYVRTVVPLGRVRLCTAGPATVDEVRAVLEPLFEGREVTPRGPLEAPKAPRRGDREATWDLTVAHYLEVYPLALDGSADRLAAEVLSQLVSMRVMDRTRPGLALASIEDFGALGPSLVVSFGGVSESRAQLRARTEAALAPLAAGKDLAQTPMAAFGLRRQFTAVPDLEALRKRLADSPGVDFIEGQIALNMAGFELRMGYPLPVLGPAFEKVDAKRVARVARGLTAARRRSVYLSPR